MGANEELVRLTATEAVARLRRREISPLELIDAAAARIEAVDGKVNALPIRFFDSARETARRHYAAFRRYAWLTGLVVLVAMAAAVPAVSESNSTTASRA